MPHHSIVRDSATPAFTLDLMQNLLRHVYVENHRRTNTPARFASSKPPFDDDTDDDLMDFPDMPENVPTLPSYKTTAADNLGSEEIAELQARGTDPYANNLLSLSSMKLAQHDPLAPLGSVVNSDIKGHYLRAKEIVEGNANLIQQVAKALLEQREMDGQALKEVLTQTRTPFLTTKPTLQ